MTPILKDKIACTRGALAADPRGVVAGEVHAPTISVSPSLRNQWTLFVDFLAEVDGGRFGSIDIWSMGEYEAKQYPSFDFPGGPVRC